MNEMNIFNKLENAFNASTQSNNLFKRALETIAWDERFYADGEYYFVKGRACFTTTSLNPFEITRDRLPEMLFSDRSLIAFGA